MAKQILTYPKVELNLFHVFIQQVFVNSCYLLCPASLPYTLRQSRIEIHLPFNESLHVTETWGNVHSHLFCFPLWTPPPVSVILKAANGSPAAIVHLNHNTWSLGEGTACDSEPWSQARGLEFQLHDDQLGSFGRSFNLFGLEFSSLWNGNDTNLIYFMD